MSDTLLEALGHEIGKLLAPIVAVAEDPARLDHLMAWLGVKTPDARRAALVESLQAIRALKTQIDELTARSEPGLADIVSLLNVSRRVFEAARALDDVAESFPELAGLGRDLASQLVASYLAIWHPVLRTLAVLATLIEPAGDVAPSLPIVRDGVLVREPFRTDRFHLDRLVSLIRDPAAVLRAEYWNALTTAEHADAVARKLFPRVQSVLRALGMTCRYGFHPDDRELIGEAAPFLEHALIIYVDDPLGGAPAASGLAVTISSTDRGDLGFVVTPFGALASTREVGDWTINWNLTAGVRALAHGRHGLTLLAESSTTEVRGSVSATLSKPEQGPALILGPPDGSRLEVGGIHIKADTTLSNAQQSLAVLADVTSAALVITPGDRDGFLDSILPAQGMRADFDLGLAWSNHTGLTLRGSAGLETTVPVGKSVAGVALSSVHLGLRTHGSRITAEVSANLSTTIGPVRAAVERVGLEGALTFPAEGGNLGVADLDLSLKPPSGIGLSVEANGLLTGGGLLLHDEAQGLYAGTMQLTLRDQITLKAFGLIATRLPGGARGYSILIFITAEDFRPIPLGLGFMLLGIGGMVGVNRTFDEEVLRQGLKNGTLATLLFPRDPMSNVNALMRALTTAFPAQPGSYLLGLLAKIGWLNPPLVLLDLALILEIGARQRLLALGRISSMLPSRENDLVRLNLDAMGVLDFDEGTAAIDAVLVDSRLAHKFAMTGAGALRARWESGPDTSFVLSVGGLHPRFAPPAGLPVLDRMAIALCSGSNPQLVCEAYFAITSNTVQFGSRAYLYASALGFSIEGDLGFDVLVQIAPLHFVADYHASVQLRRGSFNLFGVDLAGSLEGPRPLRISGKASFKIFWFSFSVRFDATLVRGEPPPLPPAVDVMAQLIEALTTAQSWSTKRTIKRPHGITLRSLPPATSAGAPLVLDPFGQLTVKQQIVPLNTARDVDTYGGAPVAGARRFRISAALNEQSLQGEALQASFAPALYFAMDEDERLAAPSFESMDAGYVFGSEQRTFDATQIISAPLQYETIVIDPIPAASPPRYTLPADQLPSLSRSGAAGRTVARRSGRQRFRNAAVAPAARVRDQRWKIIATGDGPAATVDPAVRTWSEYQAVLKSLNRSGKRWQLVPAHEIEP